MTSYTFNIFLIPLATLSTQSRKLIFQAEIINETNSSREKFYKKNVPTLRARIK